MAQLTGPDAKQLAYYAIRNGGSNDLTLYAHNEGSVSPNTAAVSVDGSEYILESDLSTNGYVDLVVRGYGVTCADSSPGGSGGATTGQVTFWTSSDLGCGPITVTVPGDGSASFSIYYASSTPACGAAGTASNSLPPGTYSHSASCTGLTWTVTVTANAGSCSRTRLIQ